MTIANTSIVLSRMMIHFHANLFHKCLKGSVLSFNNIPTSKKGHSTVKTTFRYVHTCMRHNCLETSHRFNPLIHLSQPVYPTTLCCASIPVSMLFHRAQNTPRSPHIYHVIKYEPGVQRRPNATKQARTGSA